MASNVHRPPLSEESSRVRNIAAPPVGDDLDDLFNYDAGINDVFRDVDTNMDVAANPEPARGKDKSDTGVGLGIDKEIKVTRTRRPVAKLDEARLLSQGGIPKLRRIAKDRLKFKGKAHEYKDLTRLLNFYQLWLDDLYPRAKFADALTIIEKLGHTKRMQTMRREWIDEGKPKSSFDQDTDRGQSVSNGAIQSQSPVIEANGGKENAGSASAPEVDTAQSQQRPHTPPAPSLEDDDDLYTATPGAVRVTKAPSQQTSPAKDSLFVGGDSAGIQPEGDELDMLLAEDAASGDHHQGDTAAGGASRASALAGGDDFQDEMEAMAGMDDMW